MSVKPTTENINRNVNDDFAAVLDALRQQPSVVTTTDIVSIY